MKYKLHRKVREDSDLYSCEGIRNDIPEWSSHLVSLQCVNESGDLYSTNVIPIVPAMLRNVFITMKSVLDNEVCY